MPCSATGYALAAIAVRLALLPLPCQAAEHTIAISKMKFALPAEDFRAGDDIIWRNDDIVRHSATAKDKSFDIDLPPGASVKMMVSHAGTIPFFCRFHPAMMGALNVQP